jgi:hypothetical protein
LVKQLGTLSPDLQYTKFNISSLYNPGRKTALPFYLGKISPQHSEVIGWWSGQIHNPCGHKTNPWVPDAASIIKSLHARHAVGEATRLQGYGNFDVISCSH